MGHLMGHKRLFSSLVAYITKIGGKFVPVISLCQKMVKNTCSKRNYWQPMRWASMHTKGLFFCPFGEGQGCCFLFLLFPMCSHQIPNRFPIRSSSSQCVRQHVSISTSLCPICFALSSTLVSYISSTKEENLMYKFWDYPKLDY
jgi:hypothetical protein